VSILRLLATIGLVMAATSARAEPTPPRSLSLITGVSGGAIEKNGTLWFSGWTDGMSFFLPPESEIDAQSLFPVLTDSAETSRALTVYFDPASGRFDAFHGRIAYRLCAVVTATKRFGSADGNCGSTKGTASFGLEISPSLSLGVADSATYRAASIAELTTALNADQLNPTLRVIALRARADAHSSEADKKHGSVDGHYVAALRDVAAWAKLTPEDREAWLEAASILTDLGAYDDAIRGYRAIGRHWTDEAYRVAVQIGSALRVQGRYAEALAELDRLVAAAGPQGGMKFRYNRGWTLIMLGRYDEAIREFSEGLTAQPDYPWALLQRACAYAAVGNIAKAAADQQLGLREYTKAMATQTEPSDDDRANMARADAIGKQLDALVAKGSTSPVKFACEGYIDSQYKRARSPLLKAADIAAAVGKW